MAEEVNYLPVDDIEFDKLGFKDKAEEIASFINTFPSYLPYSIGINGSWGSGKSTMLNFIEKSLNNEKCSVIRFNPWMATDPDSLIKNLFEEIYYEIDGGLSGAKEKFAEYAQKIIPSAAKIGTYFTSLSHGLDSRSAGAISGGAGEAVKGVGELLFDKPLSRRKKELHDKMTETYSYTDKKIVVMIDELDRLFPDEIITVFQMIKSALDFPGLLFIVAMDENMVTEALEKRGISKPTYYLEKIFQRNYYVKTKYQIRTLADHFLLSYLDDAYEPDKKLKDCLEAYIFQEEEMFDMAESSELKSRFGDEWELVTIEPKDIISSYYSIFGELTKELNLANPRTFIKFAVLIRELWPSYYDNVMSKEETDNFRLHAGFLIMLSYIWYPSDCDAAIFSSNGLNIIRPKFIESVRAHFDVILPKYKKQKARNSFENKRLDTVVRDATFYLNQFPDSIRHLRLSEEGKNK